MNFQFQDSNSDSYDKSVNKLTHFFQPFSNEEMVSCVYLYFKDMGKKMCSKIQYGISIQPDPEFLSLRNQFSGSNFLSLFFLSLC